MIGRKMTPIAVAGISLSLDLVAKASARAALSDRDLELSPFFALRLRYNAGTTFGILPPAGGTWMTVIAIVVVMALGWWATRKSSMHAALGAALAVAGALGNLIDRLAIGMVTDFISVRWGVWQSPIFNLADAFMVAGVMLLLLPGRPPVSEPR
jgi:signal peptidase II